MKKIFLLLFVFAMIPVAALGETTTGTATAAGYGGDISVTLAVEGGKLTDVVIKGANETQGIGTMAIEQMPQAMVNANSVKVDAVSGATRTSTGILKAAAAALAQMKRCSGTERKATLMNESRQKAGGSTGKILALPPVFLSR